MVIATNKNGQGDNEITANEGVEGEYNNRKSQTKSHTRATKVVQMISGITILLLLFRHMFYYTRKDTYVRNMIIYPKNAKSHF